MPPIHSAAAARWTTSKPIISASGCCERVWPSTANPARATAPVAAPSQPTWRRCWAGSISAAVTSRATAVTAVATPIGPRSDAHRKSSSRRASRPPPTLAMRNGRAATRATAPSTMARPTTIRQAGPAGASSVRRRAVRPAAPATTTRRPRSGRRRRRSPTAGTRRSGRPTPRRRRRRRRPGRRRPTGRRRGTRTAPAMRWESTEMTCHVTVYVPSASPVGRAMTTASSTLLGARRDLGGVVVEHAGRAAGERHRFAEPQHDLGRGGVDDRAVGGRDPEQLGVGRGEPARVRRRRGAARPGPRASRRSRSGRDRAHHGALRPVDRCAISVLSARPCLTTMMLADGGADSSPGG